MSEITLATSAGELEHTPWAQREEAREHIEGSAAPLLAPHEGLSETLLAALEDDGEVAAVLRDRV